jgi:radical SAM superfamily enzyme YgiQ (UPF0313 family)
METLAYFIVGQQTETRDDIQESMELVKRLRPNYAHFTIFCPYPGTEIYETGLRDGIIKQDVWKQFAVDPQPGFELPVWEENFSRDQLREMLVACYRDFYLRPGFLITSALRIRTLGEFARKFRAGWSVLAMSPDDQLFDETVRAGVRKVVRSHVEISG